MKILGMRQSRTLQTLDTINTTIKDKSGVWKDLLTHHLRQKHGNIDPDIKEQRSKQLDGSPAKYILQLAQFESSRTHLRSSLRSLQTNLGTMRIWLN
jgi:hypothetical protein